MTRGTLGFALALLVTSAASAQTGVGLEVRGPATIHDARITIVCGEPHDPDWVYCRLRASFTLEATGPVQLAGEESNATQVDGRPLDVEVTVEPAERVRVEVDANRNIAREPDGSGYPYDDEPFLMSPIRTRHPILGHRRVAPAVPWPTMRVSFARGAQLRIEEPVHYDLSRAAEVTVRTDRAALDEHSVRGMGVVIRPDRPDETVLHGGPVVGVGGTVGFAGHPPLAGVHLRAGYELGVLDVLVLSLAVETDFQSIAEALVIEVASPEIWFVLPSFGAGVGIVARQLGQRDADAALRLRMTVTWALLGFVADFDYWPAVGAWTGTFGARVGI